MPDIKVEPTIPNYPPQGIQAQLDLLYLWNPDVANDLIDQINEALEEVGKDLDNYLTKAEAADTYATKTEITNKVSKTGDTMTGALTFNLQARAEIIRFTAQSWLETTSTAQQIIWCFGRDAGWAIGYKTIRSEKDNFGEIGDRDYRLKNIYTYKLNNGEDITVPTVGGTLTLNEVNFKTAITDTNKGLTEADAYTKEEVDAKVSSVYRFRGSVATYNNLPTEGNVQGDVWNVEDTGANYAWDGTKWDKLSETVDLTPYLTKEDAADTYATITTVNGKQDALTAEQLAAVNSGITSAKVASYDAYAGEISTAQSTADKADNAAEVAQQTANLAGQEAAKALSGLAGKVNIAQGAENAGKVMTVGADGNLAPADAPSSSLPDQTGNAGKFLKTDGETVSWQPALVNTSTLSRALAIGTNTASSLSAISIGNDGYGGVASGRSSIVIGAGDATAIGAIQIGSYTTGGYPTNSEPYSLYIALEGTNYKLIGADGIIPSERIATIPAEDGVYTAQITVSGGVATTSWSVLDVYSKEETDQQIQNAIGTIETALAEV